MEELVIPLKLDSKKALADLQRLSGEGKAAGKAVEEGMEGASKGAKTLGSAVTDIITHQGYSMLMGIGQGLGKAFAETAAYVKEVSKEFTTLQESLRIIAAFKGMKLTDEFTVEEAKRAAAAGLTPTQGRAFEAQFQGFAGQFMGEGKKFSAAQGDELGQRAAAFMNVRGIEPAQGGAIFGEILQQATGKESTDVLMERFGKAYAMIEQAKGDPGPLLGQMGQVTAQGVDVLTGAKLMRAMAQRNPEDAGVHARAVLRGLARIRTSGEAGELGITENMDVFQQLEAINKKAPATGKEREDFIRQYFGQEEREFSGVMAGINFGVQGGLFSQADKEAAAITGRTDIDIVEEFKRSGPGSRIFNKARLAAQRIQSGATMADVEDLKVQAELALDKEGRFMHMTGLDDSIRGLIPGTPDVKQQLINERAYAMARQKSGQATGEARLGAVTAFAGFAEEQSTIDEMILAELKRANSQRDTANVQRAKVIEKPLVAQPPKIERP